ncbi:hypothetical protein [Microtetraspora malaysiensis]|uniref:hypothetical protein n=1 Tax=Microtetraspora malaysiensis TaxID=161358 RepID=UPI003D89B5AB
MNGRRSTWPLLLAILVVLTLIAVVSLVARMLDPGDQVNIADLMSVALAATALAVPVTVWARRRSAEIPAVPGEKAILAAKKTLATLAAEGGARGGAAGCGHRPIARRLSAASMTRRTKPLPSLITTQ